jgi:hypothetical protein
VTSFMPYPIAQWNQKQHKSVRVRAEGGFVFPIVRPRPPSIESATTSSRSIITPGFQLRSGSFIVRIGVHLVHITRSSKAPGVLWHIVEAKHHSSSTTSIGKLLTTAHRRNVLNERLTHLYAVSNYRISYRESNSCTHLEYEPVSLSYWSLVAVLQNRRRLLVVTFENCGRVCARTTLSLPRHLSEYTYGLAHPQSPKWKLFWGIARGALCLHWRFVP